MVSVFDTFILMVKIYAYFTRFSCNFSDLLFEGERRWLTASFPNQLDP